LPREAPVVRVGVTVVAGLLVAAAAIFLIGEKDLLFSGKNRYFVEFDNVNGLTTGNPVQLNGVDVGRVEDIILPEDTGETRLRIWIALDDRYANRIREDSIARIQTLGLLGDKYVAITSGTPEATVIPPGSEIPAAPATEIDELLSSGGDVVQNLAVAASSLSNLLTKMERGEGLLGVLVADREDGPQLAHTVAEILDDVHTVVGDLADGQGSLGRLIYDDDLADGFDTTITSLQSLLAKVEGGEGLIPRLLTDPTMGDQLESTLDQLADTGSRLNSVAVDLSEGDGLLPRLVGDEQLADELTGELRSLLGRLNEATEKLTSGDGTAALLLDDPAVYEAITDILVGIDESRILRWLVRDRQKSGIKRRYEESLEELEAAP
jgi:phospholipid/cholesterol/gamma-HCH transport system substrate-binding protein